MASGAFARRETINNYRMPAHQTNLRMTSLAGNIRMAARQGEGCAFVIESRRCPAFGSMAVLAGRLAVFCELPAVHILMTIFAILRGDLERGQAGAFRSWMACFALDLEVSPEQWEVCLHMIETVRIIP